MIRFLKMCVLTIAGIVLFSACDSERINRLHEGVSTESDVRAEFGEPERVWDGPDGGTIYEYNRLPAGHRNYMITINREGVLHSIDQVLNEKNFASIVAEMPFDDVRRTLGKPAEIERFKLKNETYYSWRYMDGTDSMFFHVVFSPDMKVLRTERSPDPNGTSSIYRNN